jgi:hypothetical protein
MAMLVVCLYLMAAYLTGHADCLLMMAGWLAVMDGWICWIIG